MKAVVSEKGQVTIPKPLRDSLALTPGTALEFEERDGVLVGRRVTEADPLSRLVGLLPRMDVDAALDELRGPAWTADLDGARRRRGGQRTRVMADFLIGAHAQVRGGRLLTRDRGFFRQYFAKLQILRYV